MRTLQIVGLIFAALGTAFAVVGAGLGVSSQRGFAALREARGEVVSNDYGVMRGDGARAVVRFETADGRQVEIRSRLRARPPLYAVGDRVSVRYDPATPDSARIDGFGERWLLPLIFGGLGTVFALVGFGILLFRALADRRDRRLKETGERHVAKVLGVVRNPNVRFNRQPAWRVQAEWSDLLTGERHAVLSRNLDFDPSPWVKPEIDVYVDRNDTSKALVDISEIVGT